MNYNAGDKVLIKSLDWYNKNKDKFDTITCGKYDFIPSMSVFCGKILTIDVAFEDETYIMKEDTCRWLWNDEMIECKVEEETKTWAGISIPDDPFTVTYGSPSINDSMNKNNIDNGIIILPEGYIFKDENGNVINTTKIVLEKANTLKTQSDNTLKTQSNMETDTHRGYCTTEPETTNKSKKVAWFTFWDNDFADKVELDLSNRELIQEDGKWFVVKKKKEYPETYEECCEVLSIPSYYKLKYSTYEHDYHEYTTSKELGVLQSELDTLGKLLICRNAYWKIYGEKMGLGKPWEPDYTEESFEQGSPIKYVIYYTGNNITKRRMSTPSYILSFPTAEMRDTFKKNFDPDIEFCKELL